MYSTLVKELAEGCVLIGSYIQYLCKGVLLRRSFIETVVKEFVEGDLLRGNFVECNNREVGACYMKLRKKGVIRRCAKRKLLGVRQAVKG
jgi:hypothetical protein